VGKNYATYDQFRRKSLWGPCWYFSCNIYSRDVSDLKTRSDLCAGLSAHTYSRAPHNDISVNDGLHILLLLLLLLIITTSTYLFTYLLTLLTHLLQLSFHSVAVIITLETNNNKYT